MTSKEARVDRPVAARRQQIIWWGVGLGGVFGLLALVGRSWGPDQATAQAPVVRPSPSSPNTRPPAPVRGGTASGTSTSRGTTAPAPSAKSGAPGAAAPASGSISGGSGVRPATASSPLPAGNGTAASAQLKVLAVVNGQQVTRQDLARECVARYGKEVLESIVNKTLILNACKANGITITQQDVENEIERIAKKFNLSTDRWLQLLQEERNITPGDYRAEIIWPTLALRSLAASKTEVSPEELQQAFEAEFGPKVSVRVISVTSLKKAQELLAKAKADPENFATLAKDHSEDPSASVMGLIPPIRKYSGNEQLEKIAFAMKKGEISQVISVANHHLIIKCEGHLEATYLAGADLKIAQDRLRDRIRDQKLRTSSADLFQKLQKQAQVVNVINDPEKQKQNPGVAALINGQPISMNQLAEECIARHGLTVLDGEINRLILTQELKKRNRTVDDNDIQEEVSHAADMYGYTKSDGSPDVEKWLKAVTENDGATVELYVRDAVWPSAALKKLVGGSAPVTEDDLQKGFESNYGERVEVLAIVLSNQRQAQQVWEMARDNPTDHFFGELASQYSIEPASRSNMGKVPPIRRHGGQPLVEEAAYRLKPGELSGIVSMGDKFIIMRCQGRTRPVVQEFTAEVRQELMRDISEKKLRISMAKEFDRLKETAQVDNFLAGTSQSGKQRAVVRADATPKLEGQTTLAPVTTTPRAAAGTTTPRAATGATGTRR